MRTRLLAAAAAAALLTTATATTALPGLDAVVPVKCNAEDVTPDGRVFPEPQLTATFLSIAEFECGIEVLEEAHPGLIETTVIGTSAAGHDIHDVVLTDESVPEEDKRHLLVLSSIHGNEHAGREGAARVIEDLVDPRFLAEEEWVVDTLEQFVVHVVFPNPDGWGNGQITGEDDAGVNFTRNNDGGRDLNRNFPVQGFLRSSNGTLDQPEGEAIDALLARHADTEHDVDDPDYRGWYLGTDNHGQGVKPVAASGLQIVGQFDYQKSERLAQFADSIAENMDSIALDSIEALNAATGGAVQPYEWGTLYDILGYSASGSVIDYYNTPGVVEGTGFATEMTASNLPFSNIATHPGLVNQMWVDTVRAIDYAMFKSAVAAPEFTFPVPGDVAYVLDPTPTASDDLDGFGPGWGQAYDPADVPANFTGDDDGDFAYTPYEASRMRFFEDLDRHAERPITPVRVGDVLSGATDLAAYDQVVLADEVMPEAGDRAAWIAALGAYVDGGGHLIVTDAAAPVLADLVVGVDAADVSVVKRDVGYVDFGQHDQLNADLRGVASQTYDVVPIGYPDNGDAAPNWRVATAAWEAAGGVTAGTNGAGQTIYGAVPRGDGQILFLGALLPEPTEAFFHPYGLQDYAVTYTGYTLLANMFAYEG